MPLYIIKMFYSLLFWTDHFMYSFQEYTKLADLHPRVQERIKKLDPAEYSNMANPHNSSRYMYLVFWDNYILLWSSRLRLNIHSLGKLEIVAFDIARRFSRVEISRYTRARAYTRAKLVACVWRRKWMVTTNSLPAPRILAINLSLFRFTPRKTDCT